MLLNNIFGGHKYEIQKKNYEYLSSCNALPAQLPSRNASVYIYLYI